jgi:hypothetical protein
VGINDITNSYRAPGGPTKSTTLNEEIFTEYLGQMETLYVMGAHNFLFLNVPPIDRSPGTTAKGKLTQAIEKLDVADYNARLAVLVKTLKRRHDDVTVFTVNTNEIFTNVLENVKAYRQTASYKNTTNYCAAYAK